MRTPTGGNGSSSGTGGGSGSSSGSGNSFNGTGGSGNGSSSGTGSTSGTGSGSTSGSGGGSTGGSGSTSGTGSGYDPWSQPSLLFRPTVKYDIAGRITLKTQSNAWDVTVSSIVLPGELLNNPNNGSYQYVSNLPEEAHALATQAGLVDGDIVYVTGQVSCGENTVTRPHTSTGNAALDYFQQNFESDPIGATLVLVLAPGGLFDHAVTLAPAAGAAATGKPPADLSNPALPGMLPGSPTGQGSAKPASKAPSKRVTGAALANMRKEFNAVKPQAWKDEAARNPQKYTKDQLARMRNGQPPIGSDGYPMEIHHKKPLAEGGTNTFGNYEFLERTDHRLGPNYKKNHPNFP